MSLTLSTVSSQYQTTIPQTIRELLHVSKNDKIRYRVVCGAVVIEKAEPPAARLSALHKSIRKKVADVTPGLTAREARERSVVLTHGKAELERDVHDA